MSDTTQSLPSDDDLARQTDALLQTLGDGIADRSLIAVLQRVQSELGYLPRVAMLAVGRFLELSPAKVYGVATFYNQFRFTPPGKHQIKVCMGTACAIKLGGVILDSFERRLGIGEGETTADREYSLERVACVGCCSLAPVAVVGEQVQGDMTPTKVDGLLLQDELQRKKDAEQGSPHAEGEA